LTCLSQTPDFAQVGLMADASAAGVRNDDVP